MIWISVKDRLPDNNCMRLLITNGITIEIGWWNGDGEKRWIVGNGPFIFLGVTHWQPLPELPDKENRA